MAQRRMVSVKIIDSAKFIKMPVSTQALYFHLIARADDDGIVEAFNVMRMTGASEDDLKVLVAKDFAKLLNEDLVTYITDWHEHNLIRADRKVDSIYQNLLLQIVGDVEIKEKKERADRRKNILQLNNGTSQGQSTDGIGKGSVGKFSKGKEYKKEINTEINNQIKEIRSCMNKDMVKSLSSAEAKLPSIIKQYGVERTKNALDLYTKEVLKQRKNGFESLKFVNESTFWNSRYKDYINIEPDIVVVQNEEDFWERIEIE